LLIALIAISVLRYETVTGSALLHEISQRLYYLPIVYAAYRYGLRGGLTASLVSAALYFPHIVQHLSSRGSAINLYAETILFLVIGAVTGLLAGKERRERERHENAAAALQRAYDELRAMMSSSGWKLRRQKTQSRSASKMRRSSMSAFSAFGPRNQE
jgi:two-component system sensor histidine kinase HydH